MKVLYVIQAYGEDVFGGAESHCRMMATRMAERGHQVDVLTSCANRYERWENVYKPGVSVLEGVNVHRLAVDAPRNLERFGPLSGRVLTGHKPVPLFLQEEWIDQQGPHLPELQPWLWDNALNYDVVIFFTYLYYPTVRGLPLVSGRVPTVMHALAHDEPPFYLNVFDELFKLPSGFAYSVEEDAELMERRAHPSALTEIVGIGTELDVTGNGARFRQQFDLGDSPYVVCIGRVDAHKGSYDLYEYFSEYKQRNHSDLKLVFVGEAVADSALDFAVRDDIVITGWVDKDVRSDALDGAVASIHPSYFESFSMALIEAWAMRCPALVNGRCNVFAGQASRSGGAIAYHGFAEFEVGLDMLLAEAATIGTSVPTSEAMEMRSVGSIAEVGLRKSLANAGRAYVEHRYNWSTVMDTYENFLRLM